MRLLMIDYLLEHAQNTSRWALSQMTDTELLAKYNETRDTVKSIQAL